MDNIKILQKVEEEIPKREASRAFSVLKNKVDVKKFYNFFQFRLTKRTNEALQKYEVRSKIDQLHFMLMSSK